MPTMPSLGALRCATIVCPSVDAAVRLYCAGLGYCVLERGVVSAALAESWGAEATTGAACAVLGPASGAATYLRFVEDADALPPRPYATLGWAALEFSVQSSDAAVDRLASSEFTVLGAAQDLAFSQGALRAGQVGGPHGEVLYLTQINAQLDNYALPVASVPVDRMFIAIAGVTDIADAYRCHAEQFGMQPKDRFEAEVPFIADFHGLPRSHAYQIGCLETVPGSYVEVDRMPETVTARPRREGHLPSGIAMVSFEAAELESFRSTARGSVGRRPEGIVYGDRRSVTVVGPNGAWTELIQAPVAT